MVMAQRMSSQILRHEEWSDLDFFSLKILLLSAYATDTPERGLERPLYYLHFIIDLQIRYQHSFF